jgi:O-antigen ligase
LKNIIHTIFKQKWVLILILLFIAGNSILIAYNWYYLVLLPFVVLIVFLAFVSAEKLLLLTVFCVPLSVPLEKFYPSFGYNLQLPSEIMIILLLIVFILKVLFENSFDVRIVKHPVSIAIYAYLFWIFLTSLTSTMPLVSFKFFVSRVWFIAVFYFLSTQFFQTKRGIRQYFWAYFLSFLVVAVFAMTKMWSKGFLDQYIAQRSAQPFFRDHTSYGAIIAMVLPFIIGFVFYRKYSIRLRAVCVTFSAIMFFALIVSYTRAAWISVGIAFFAWLLFVFRIKLVYVGIVLTVVLGILYVNQTEIKLEMEQNQQNSSKDLEKHLKSIYNIRSDASNLERINRWNSAMKMFAERPVFGWGPGTYMFKYAPFQVTRDKTVISTNRGDWGNAHSEFIGPLAESGFMGTLTFVVLLITVFYTAVKRYALLEGKYTTRLLLLSATLGLITYTVHGFLNNYLDTDKASVLFWGYIAIVVAIDVYHKGNETVIPQN